VYGEGGGNINKKNIMETIKKEAIELLKKETTKMKELRIKNGEFEFKGECADVGESYSELVLDGLGGMRYSIHDYDAEGTLLGIWKKEFGKIQPGDYFIARKPKRNSAPLSWCASMDKYDGIIQKCERISFYGSIVSGDPWVFFHPDWCEKVSVGDVMKTEYDDLFIFKGVSDGDYLDFAYYRGGKPPKLFIDDTPNSMVAVSHATKGEEQVLFNALARVGKKWNKKKLIIEDRVHKIMKATDENVLHGTISTGESVTTGTVDDRDNTTTSIYDCRAVEYMLGEIIDTFVKDDSIEIVYRYHSIYGYHPVCRWPYKSDCDKVCKIIYSCKNGKWHVSDPIIGKIIPAREESYEF